MARHKSKPPNIQSSSPSLQFNRETHACGNDYCNFSTHSIEELAKHLDNCQFAPFAAPTVKRAPSDSIEPMADATSSLPSLNHDQENIASVTQKEPNGNHVGDDSSSSLSDPPPISNFSELEAQFDPEALKARKSQTPHAADKLLDNADDTIRAYVEDKVKLVFYETAKDPKSKVPAAVQDQNEPEVLATEVALAQNIANTSFPQASKRPKVSTSGRYGFNEMTPVSVFENFLLNPQAMSYEELHRKTSQVTAVMMELQSEWDHVDKICRAHEESEKLRSATAAEKEKALADEKQEEEDLILISLENTYREELKLSRKPWIDDFSAQFLATNPDGQLTLERLNKLRDSGFVKGFKKRQRALQENRPEQLVDKPLPEPKQTKEERDLEARKRRHLTDKITFDDMAQADAYGFSYLTTDLARGNQLLLPKLRVVSLPKNLKAGSRPPRNATKGSVVESAENSEVPSGDEELPQKRARAKPKKLEDDTNGASSAAESSRGAGSAKTYVDEDGVRRYKSSHKPSGRPATTNKAADRPGIKKSKLDQMSLAEHAEQSNEIEDEESRGVDGDSLNGQILGSEQEDELHTAAASLFSQTSPVQQKKRGGRPKKVQPATQNEIGDDLESLPKPKGKGGRKKKADLVALPAVEGAVNDLLQLPPKPKGKGGRPRKRPREEDAAEVRETESGLAAKRVKSEGLDIKMKMPASNGVADSDREDPFASIEQHRQSTQSSRPTTSSSKPTTTSKPASRAASLAVSQVALQPTPYGDSRVGSFAPPAASLARSHAPAVAAASNHNGKRAYDEINNGQYGTGIVPGAIPYSINTEDGAHISKKARNDPDLREMDVNGLLNNTIINGDASVGEDDRSQPPKIKKKASVRRKRANGAGGLTGAGNTADATNNNSGADDGGSQLKRSRKSREKTEAEKASQSAAMKTKWADPDGKMRQGINKRKRREARLKYEKTRVQNGGAPDPERSVKSDEDDFDKTYFPAHIYDHIVTTTTAPAPVLQPAQITEGNTPTAEDDNEHNVQDEDQDGNGDEDEAELAVESPKQSNRPAPINTNIAALTTTRSGRQSKPSRKVETLISDEEPEFYRYQDHQDDLTTYDQFRMLTSPGHQLGKRVSKPMYNVNYGSTSEEGEDDSN